MELFSDFEDILGQYNGFNHATVVNIQVGPRREITIALAPLLWDGFNGVYGEEVSVRFGGVVGLNSFKHFFASLPGAELASVRLSKKKKSKKNQLHIEIELERELLGTSFQCQNITIRNPPDPERMSPILD